ncbi:MAG TPA: YhgE/Pip domain-containing protein, partial [Rhodocyclaceae bacterium]|nr:YhgE/Pip domain-containing protein [Rhodocyclaceae bacterium]
AGLFRRFPRFRLAVVGALFIPAIYAFIYLSSVWDPNARTAQLPVGLVQEDQGTTYRDQPINMGAELVASLENKHAFHYHRYPDGDAARLAVREGKMVFALIVPRDFSLHAVPGNEAGGGKLVIYTSEGNSYNGAGFAKRFAPELAHQMNETLNEKRWALVLETAAGSAQNLDTLRNGMRQLRNASVQLAAGMKQADSGGKRLDEAMEKLAPAGIQLADGIKQVSGGLRQMQGKLPNDEALQSMKTGASVLAKQSAEMADGLDKLHTGAGKLAAGISEVKSQSADIPLLGRSVTAAASELESGAEQLHEGLQRARDGQLQLADGAKKLDGGVSALTDGVTQMSESMKTITGKLPAEPVLNRWSSGLNEAAKGSHALTTGLAELNDGAARLETGITLINNTLPKVSPEIEGNPKGLANSVEPELEIVAPVANNGTGFAVNFVPLALWVGAVMSAFLFQLRHVPHSVSTASQAALTAGKIVIPALISVAQALIMLLMLTFVLDVSIPSTLTFALTLVCASLTFFAIIFALIRLFGDTGKVISVLFLILQLSSAGALMPVELTSKAFQILHPLLPFTWIVKAFRASLFGAYDGAWLFPWSVAILSGVIGLLIAMFAGHWKIVSDEDYRPAVDLP